MHNNEGIPLYYVIADLKKRSPSFQKKCKDIKYQVELFNQDDFRVVQWFKLALAKGLPYNYMKNYSGDARHIYQSLKEVYHSRSKKEPSIRGVQVKLRAIQY